MHGLITTRHLLTKGPLIIREFGLAVYGRCVRAVLLSRQPVTFLDCVFQPAPRPMNDLSNSVAS